MERDEVMKKLEEVKKCASLITERFNEYYNGEHFAIDAFNYRVRQSLECIKCYYMSGRYKELLFALHWCAMVSYIDSCSGIDGFKKYLRNNDIKGFEIGSCWLSISDLFYDFMFTLSCIITFNIE